MIIPRPFIKLYLARARESYIYGVEISRTPVFYDRASLSLRDIFLRRLYYFSNFLKDVYATARGL